MPENTRVHHCVEKLKAQGHSESSAIAICQSSTEQNFHTGKPLRKGMQGKKKAAPRPLNQLRQEMADKFNVDPLVLRLHGEDRHYYDLNQEAHGPAHDYLLENLDEEPTGHGEHPGGHVHVSFSEGSHEGSQFDQYGVEGSSHGHISEFNHLGRNVREYSYNPQVMRNNRSNVFWHVETKPTQRFQGIGNTEREARTHANDQYHEWHAQQHQQGQTGQHSLKGLRSKKKAASKPIEQVHAEVARQFGSDPVTLRLHNEERVHFSPGVDPETGQQLTNTPSYQEVADYYRDYGHEPTSNNEHSGGHVSIGFPVGTHQVGHSPERTPWGEEEAPTAHSSSFHILGRRVRENYSGPVEGGRLHHTVWWHFRNGSDPYFALRGRGNSQETARHAVYQQYLLHHEREARSQQGQTGQHSLLNGYKTLNPPAVRPSPFHC